MDYAERRDGTAAIQLEADLKEARLVTPLGWSKAAGTPGHAEARALLDHGRLVGLEGLRAEAPGLAVAARSDLVDGRPSVVHLERGEIGRSSATGSDRAAAARGRAVPGDAWPARAWTWRAA